MIKVAQDAGWKAVGIDPSRWAVEYARNNFGVDAIVTNLLSFHAESDLYDFITMYDALEHTFDPLSNLRKALEILKSGGFLVIGIPDFGHYKAKKQGRNWGAFIPPEHLFYFDLSTLKRICMLAGLQYFGRFFRFPYRDTLKAVFQKPSDTSATKKFGRILL